MLLAAILLLVFCSVSFAAAAPVEVEASLTPQSFPVNRAARFTITVAGRQSAAIALPDVANVRLHERGKSSQFNMINGTMSSSVSYNYLVEALKPGNYVMPAVKVTVDGVVHETSPINFTVTAVGSGSGSSGDAGKSGHEDDAELAFIRISETGRHYPGEIVPLTIKAYFNRNYRADVNSLPVLTGDGVVMDQLTSQPRQSEESVGGARYNVLSWDTTLSGIKAGSHPFKLSLNATLLIPQTTRRSPISSFGGSSLFDDSFFDSFLGGYSQRPITLVSPERIFEVVDLPEKDQPADFTGAIGDFSMQVSAQPVDIEVGEPITLKVAISGQGNFARVDIPEFPDSSGWKTYDPTSEFSEQKNSYTGSKRFERAIVARNRSLTEIPSLSFSYFDPKAKQYVIRTSKPIPVHMKQAEPAPLQPQSPPTASRDIKAPPPDPSAAAPGIHHFAPIKIEMGSFSREIQPLFKKGWFIIFVVFCILTLTAVLIFSVRSARLQKNPHLAILRKRKQRLAKDLQSIESAQLAHDSARFLQGCRIAIQNQLGLLWGIEPSAISLSDLANRLPQAAPLIELFKMAEESVYGGFSLTNEEMQDTFDQLGKELEALL